MDFSDSTEQTPAIHNREGIFFDSLLARGLQLIKQGRYAEGVVFLTLERERLPPEQAELSLALDVFTQGHLDFWQAQEVLHAASKRFVEADAAQRARIAELEEAMIDKLDISTARVSQHSERATAALVPDSDVESRQEVPDGPSIPSSSPTYPQLPPLYFTCFYRFEVRRAGETVKLCANGNGLAILRYLAVQPEHRATMDVLMTLLWPEDEQEVAQHKLQVSVSAVRCALNAGCTDDSGRGYILCKKGSYQLNPAVDYHSDIEEFLAYYQAGQQSGGVQSMAWYEKACQLYRGPFLMEDLYTDWSFIRREQLSQVYFTMCMALADFSLSVKQYENVVRWATAVLKENRCDEAAHCILIGAYAAQGRRSYALRQYQRCETALAEELGASPMPETVQLMHSLLA